METPRTVTRLREILTRQTVDDIRGPEQDLRLVSPYVVHGVEHKVKQVLYLPFLHIHGQVDLQKLRSQDYQGIIPFRQAGNKEVTFFVGTGFLHQVRSLIQAHPGILHAITAHLGEHPAFHATLLCPQHSSGQKTQ